MSDYYQKQQIIRAQTAANADKLKAHLDYLRAVADSDIPAIKKHLKKQNKNLL